MLRLRRNSGDPMVKCSKRKVPRLKPAPRWKIPAAQRQRSQVLWGRGMTQPPIARGDRRAPTIDANQMGCLAGLHVPPEFLFRGWPVHDLGALQRQTW